MWATHIEQQIHCFIFLSIWSSMHGAPLASLLLASVECLDGESDGQHRASDTQLNIEGAEMVLRLVSKPTLEHAVVNYNVCILYGTTASSLQTQMDYVIRRLKQQVMHFM